MAGSIVKLSWAARVASSVTLLMAHVFVLAPKEVASQERESPVVEAFGAKSRTKAKRTKVKNSEKDKRTKRADRSKTKRPVPEKTTPRPISPPAPPTESISENVARLSFLEGLSGRQNFPDGAVAFEALRSGGALSFGSGTGGGRSGGTSVAARDEAAPSVDPDETLSAEFKQRILEDIPTDKALAATSGYIPKSWNCSGISVADISDKVNAFCGPMEGNDLQRLVKSLFQDTNATSCLAGVSVQDGYLLATFVTKNPSQLARIGIERSETRYWSCVRAAANQPVKGSLVLARLVKKELTWNFTRARVGASLVVNTGIQKFKFDDISYKDGKEDEKKWVRGETAIRPRQPGITPYRSENCGREPKAGCAYWQIVEATWSGAHTGRCESGENAIFAKFKDVGVIAYPYESRVTPFFSAGGKPWLMLASFQGKTDSCVGKTSEALTVEGRDPMTCVDTAGKICNPMCSWTEHERTPGVGGMLHTIHQTFPEVGKLGADLDADYRDATCAICGSIPRQPVPAIAGKCIS